MLLECQATLEEQQALINDKLLEGVEVLPEVVSEVCENGPDFPHRVCLVWCTVVCEVKES